MRYDEVRGVILISCRELVSVARRGICAALPHDEDEPTSAAEFLGEQISLDFTAAGYEFSLVVRAAAKGDAVRLTVPTDTSPQRPRKEVVAEARGEGFISAYALTRGTPLDRVRIEYLYINRATGEENEIIEYVSKKKLESFFEKCKIAVGIYARPEIERVTKRLPSLRGIKFPYKNVRDGQEELMHSVYKSICRGGRLFTAAPTGTGKTVSMLYPAVRALGEGKCDKIFYFTPKTTTANAAMDCIRRLGEVGARLRAVIISAKERTCENRTVCRQSHSLCENTKNNKLADAVLELYDTGHEVVTVNEVREVARRHSVCPYELTLSYSELCDVVVCDINYLFDPHVYIRRYFTDGGEYAFLIDEAHNLPDRAREMYSAEITLDELLLPTTSTLIGEAAGIRGAARETAEAFKSVLMPLVTEDAYRTDDGRLVGATHLSDVPTELYDIFLTLTSVAEDEIFKSYAARDEDSEARQRELKNYYYRVKAFFDTLLEFDSCYELFIFLDGESLRAKCFCIDPSHRISKMLDKGRCAVFFSGTLSPMYYYRAVLGGDASSTVLEVDSPFDPSQLSVSIMDKISTRLSERDDTLVAVCRVIAATVSAKRGNYMIFSPSFAYSEALARVFRTKYPKIRVLEQRRDMGTKEKRDFLAEFEKENSSYLIGFCVMGGIYSEGVDLAGNSLIGAVIVGIGIPALSYEREAICAYYNDKYEEGKQFAYIYPGMNRVLQAAGRVIRREDDRGVIVLIDDRFDDPIYKSVIPKLWKDMKFIGDPKELRAELDGFWQEEKS